MSAAFDWKRFITNRLEFIALTGIVVGLLGELGSVHWLFDLANHFRLQLVVGLVICAIGLCALRQKLVTATVCAGAILLSAPLWPRPPLARPPAPANSISLLSFNINSANTHYAAVREFIIEANPEVVVLIEVDEEWERELRSLDAKYPHSKIWSRPDYFGMAIYSQLPFVDAKIHLIGDYDLPAIEATVQSGENDIRVIGIHPLPPTSQRSFQEQNAYLQKSVDLIQAQPKTPTALVGDFNLTPASPRFRKFLKQTNLRYASKTPGLNPTWMRHNPLIALPLDHILISEHIAAPANYALMNIKKELKFSHKYPIL